MKKLIEEIEKEIEKIRYNDKAHAVKNGLCKALSIVKSYDPWQSIYEHGLPEPDKLLWFLCRDGGVFLGYYASYIEDGFTHYLWSVLNGMIYREGNEIVVESVFDDDYDVTHYRYIPTDLPEVNDEKID